MSKIISDLVSIGVGKESSRGTAVAPTYWIPWVNLTFFDKVQKYTSMEALGVLDDSHEEFVGEAWGEGELEGEIRDKSFGLLLLALFGAVADANPAGSVYTHTYTIQQANQHQSLTIAVDDPNSGDRQFPLAMIEKMDLDFVLGQVLRHKTTFISKASESASVTKSFVTENKFIPSNITFKLATTRSGLAAATPVKLQSLKLTINKNLLRKHVLGSISPDDIINQAIGIEGTFQLPYQDQTYKALMTGQTYNAMQIDILNTAVDLGSGYSPRLQIILPRCSFRDWTPERSKGQLHEQTVGFKAMRDVANSEDLMYQTILTNAVASY